MTNRCEDCVFFKRQHYLTSTLLHGVMYVCTIKGKIIQDRQNHACREFIDKDDPNLKEKDRAE